MKIHFYYKHDFMKDFYSLELFAYMEENETSRIGERRLSFTQLENLRIFFSKGTYHDHSMKHEFGKNSCHGHWAHTRKELDDNMITKGFKKLSCKDYERFRSRAIALYCKQKLVDFSEYKGKQTYSVRQIIGD